MAFTDSPFARQILGEASDDTSEGSPFAFDFGELFAGLTGGAQEGDTPASSRPYGPSTRGSFGSGPSTDFGWGSGPTGGSGSLDMSGLFSGGGLLTSVFKFASETGAGILGATAGASVGGPTLGMASGAAAKKYVGRFFDGSSPLSADNPMFEGNSPWTPDWYTENPEQHEYQSPNLSPGRSLSPYGTNVTAMGTYMSPSGTVVGSMSPEEYAASSYWAGGGAGGPEENVIPRAARYMRK